ncbi:MAG: MFS transporter [Pseudomonadota bacterium]
MANYRNVFVLIVAGTLLQLAGGILGVITPLGLDAVGASAPMIGVVAALNAIGFMIGAWYSADAIRLFGNIRVYAAAAAGAAVTLLFMHMVLDPGAWAFLRLVQGAALAFMFSSIEAWLGAAVPTEKRGQVSGFYHLMAKIGLIAGPFFALGMSAIDPQPYQWGAIFLAMSTLPVCLTRRGEPPVPDVEPLSLHKLFLIAPAGVVACFVAGVVNTGTLSLLPIYAMDTLIGLGLTPTGQGAWAAAAVWGGGLLSQWPAGLLSDHIERRFVIGALSAIFGLAAAGLAFLPGASAILVLVLLGVWGIGALSYYGIAVAHTIDRAPPGKIAQVMAGLIFVWAVGSVLGPILAGLAMQTPMGPQGLFMMSVISGPIMVLIMLWRRAVRDAPKDAAQEPWNPTTPLLVGKGEVDPRVD